MTLFPCAPDSCDFFVEWQITDEGGRFIDLGSDVSEVREVLLAEQVEVRTTSGG